MTYATSFSWEGEGDDVFQVMDKIFPTQEEREKSNFYIKGIEGNDKFFSKFNFFASIDFGKAFIDFICDSLRKRGYSVKFPYFLYFKK